jgi:hypothetical protein
VCLPVVEDGQEAEDTGAAGEGLVEECRRALEEAGRIDSVAGQVVLVLAGRLVAGGPSASGVAALSRELRAAMGEALRDAPGKEDRLERLARKWAGA